jgi:hypothetical protein
LQLTAIDGQIVVCSVPSPPSVELGVKPGADGRASQSDQVIVLASLDGSAEICRAGGQEAMVHAIAFQVHQFAARRVGTNLETQDAAAELKALSLAASLASRQIRTFTPCSAAARRASMTALSVST